MVTRVVGLASGLDIDSWVTDMMTAERIPLDKLEQQKIKTEWQRDEYREVNKMLSDFDTFLFDSMSLSSKLSAKKTSSTNINVVTVTTASTTPNTSVTMTVQKVATSSNYIGKTEANITTPLEADSVLAFQVKKGKESEYETIEVALSAGDTYETIAKKINSAKVGVTALYDAASNTFALTASSTGESFDIRLSSESAETLQKIANFNTNEANAFTPSSEEGVVTFNPTTRGTNAEFTYNGIPLTREANTFEINGLNITLRGKSEDAVTLTTEADTEAVTKIVEDFVTKYNAIVERFNQEYTEKKYRDYAPLTEAQKKEMEEDQIKLWEEKAKSGLLRGDSTLSNALTNMRGILSYSSALADLGIKPSTSYTENGKLTLDKEKLTAAISANPDIVYEAFKGTGTAETNIVDSLRTQAKKTVKTIEEKAGNTLKTNEQFTLGKQLETLDDRIEAFKKRLETLETRYYKQFAAMEEAISHSNSQSAYISQMFSTGY